MSDDPCGVKVSLTQWVRITLKVNTSRYGRQELDEAANLQNSLRADRQATARVQGMWKILTTPSSPIPTNQFLDFLLKGDKEKLRLYLTCILMSTEPADSTVNKSHIKSLCLCLF